MGENVQNLKTVVTGTEPTAYTSRLNMIQFNAPVDVVPMSNAQVDWMTSAIIHGAEFPPMIPRSPRQIDASTDIQHNKSIHLSIRNQNEIQPRLCAVPNQWVNAEPSGSAILKVLRQLSI